jgi:ABC-2 type transport system permease protein
LSSAFFPPELSGGWFEAVAAVNPVSWIVDAARSLVIDGFTFADAVTAIGITGILMSVLTSGAVLTLQRVSR